MGYLDSFVLVVSNEKTFITVRKHSITFSKKAIEGLHFCPFVHMYVDKNGKHVVFKETNEDENAIPFYRKPMDGRAVLVRITDSQKAQMLLDIAGMEASEKGVKFYGKIVPEEKLIDFDLSKES